MNCTHLGELSSIVTTHENAMIEITSAPQIVVQSLPVALGFILWVIIEAARRKRTASERVRRIVRFLTFLSTLAISLAVWRFTTVLTCALDQRSLVWNVLATAGLVGMSLFVLFALAIRRPRSAILVSLLIAAGIVVTDVGLRGWWNIQGVGLAAQHLMPVQHLWVLHAIAILFHLERRTLIGMGTDSSRRHSSTTRRPVIEVVDSLAHRDDLQPPTRGGACSERGRERSSGV